MEVATSTNDSWSLMDHYHPNLSLLNNEKKDNIRSEAVIIIDPISTGAMLAYQLFLKGFKIVAVFSRQYSEEILSTYLPSAIKEDKSFKSSYIEPRAYCSSMS